MSRHDDSTREAFWRELRPRLELYLRSFSGLSPEDREDVLQRTLLAFLGRLGEPPASGLSGASPSERFSGDPRAWLYRVARNAAIDAIRAARREERRGRRVHIEQGLSEPESPYRGPEASVLDAAEEAFVTLFLAGLPETDRGLLHLAYAEGLSYPEISEATGRPLGTVKWRMAALKRRLKAAYDKEYA